jgi:hypothetical protein
LLGLNLQNATVAIQGFGNVGGWAAILSHHMGMKVVAVSGVCAVVFRTVPLPEMPHWLEAGGRGALAGGAALAGGLALGAIPELRDAIRRTVGR